MSSFLDLGVPARFVESLERAGIAEPFPVQAATLPDALAGRDLCGRAPTGSGKTLGFGIPLMARISQAEPRHPTGLVLVPTRELAEQVQRAFVPLGRAAWRFVQAVYGGAPMGPQVHSLRKGASVVVATPGRLLDLIEQGHCDLGKVEVLVIDEADRMADLGFMPDVRKIIDMTPSTRQTMLWSATLDGDVNELVKDYLNDPARHDLVGERDFGNIDHRFVVTPPTDRIESAVELMKTHGPTMVFVKTRFGVEDVTAALMNAGVRAASLHGGRTQQARTRTLEDFKRAKVQALVATDVAARGIHVDDVDLVIHYDLPDNEKDFLHRSGRTGRAGKDGVVIAFVPPSRQRVARRMIEALQGLDVEVTWDGGSASGPRERTERREWTPRPPRADGSERSDRPRDARGERPTRPAYGDRTDRPRSDRPAYGDRTDRPRSDRPAYGDRTDRPRSDRPAYGDRTARPSRGEWTPRGERPAAAGSRPHAPAVTGRPRHSSDRRTRS
jgi:superfamily II DNA/RNA helicase